MSSENLWQICHKKHLTNKCFSEQLVLILKDNGLTTKQVAGDLGIYTERVRNWYYKNTGMVAYDLLLLLKKYDFIRRFFMEESLQILLKNNNGTVTR